MISNLNVYLAIAEESLAESEWLEQSARAPKPDGEPGFIITYDPKQRSFKCSLIAITFAGIYLEALLYVVGVRRLGKSEYMKIDRKCYEEKLQSMGLTDSELLATCKRFREVRNDLVHEKAMEVFEVTEAKFHIAQRQARDALSFVKQVAELLPLARNEE